MHKLIFSILISISLLIVFFSQTGCGNPNKVVPQNVASFKTTKIPLKKIDMALGDSYKSIREKIPIGELNTSEVIWSAAYNGYDNDFEILSFEGLYKGEEITIRLFPLVHFHFDRKKQLRAVKFIMAYPDLYLSQSSNFTKAFESIDQNFLGLKDRFKIPQEFPGYNVTLNKEDGYYEVLYISEDILGYQIGTDELHSFQNPPIKLD